MQHEEGAMKLGFGERLNSKNEHYDDYFGTWLQLYLKSVYVYTLQFCDSIKYFFPPSKKKVRARQTPMDTLNSHGIGRKFWSTWFIYSALSKASA